MAHPDDAELWAGGTLARLARAGTAVTIAVPEHGDAIRNSEAAAAARELGARYQQCPTIHTHTLQDLLNRVRPEVVITHPLDDIHPDYRHVAVTLTAALPEIVIATGVPRRVYTGDTYNGLTKNARSPRTASSTRHRYLGHQDARFGRARLPAHRRALRPHAETLGRLWGSRIGVHYGENFTPLPVLSRVPAATEL